MGRLPIVLLPSAPNRSGTRSSSPVLLLAVVGLILDLARAAWRRARGRCPAGLPRGLPLVPRACARGSKAILLRRGRIDRTIGPGNHIIPPWIAVSHLVTMREIPFDVPVTEVPTQEGLRVSVDVLLTFRITRPEQFVFSISAPDFDQVCQAAGQDALRLLVRSTTAEHVLDLAGTNPPSSRRPPDARWRATASRSSAWSSCTSSHRTSSCARSKAGGSPPSSARRRSSATRSSSGGRGSGNPRTATCRGQARTDRDRGRQRGAPPGTAPGTSRGLSPGDPLRPRVRPAGRREGAGRQYARHAPGRIGRRHRERPRDARPGRRARRR